MTDGLYGLEDNVRSIAIGVRTEYAERLANLRLEARIGLRKNFHDGVLDAELQIKFLCEDDLVDALEGFVIKDSRLAVSDDELTLWLQKGIHDVISRHTTL